MWLRRCGVFLATPHGILALACCRLPLSTDPWLLRLRTALQSRDYAVRYLGYMFRVDLDVGACHGREGWIRCFAVQRE